jgi:hypothetical protein
MRCKYYTHQKKKYVYHFATEQKYLKKNGYGILKIEF